MAKPAVYEPAIRTALEAHPDGLSADQLAELVGCSRQMAYKTVTGMGCYKVGKTETAAILWSLTPVPRQPVSTVGVGVPMQLGEWFQVVGMTMLDDRVAVQLHAEEGGIVTVTVDPV